MNKISEKNVAGLWMSGRLANLIDDLGNCIEVVCPGRIRAGRGCDFQDAVIRFNRQKVVGDIEVHVTSDLWLKHGHHQDPAFNGVILHVAMWQKGGLPLKLQDGSLLPTVILSRHIIDVYSPALRRWQAAGLPPCARRDGTGKSLNTILLIEGLRRFEEKAAGFSGQLKTAVAGQVLYKGICRALGYAGNKAPFEALADRMPLAVVLKLAAASLPAKQAVLLGAAGLLPSQNRVTEQQCHDYYMEDLESRWSKLSGNILSGKAADWNLALVRPVNHPFRRIAALSYLLQRYEQSGLLRGLERLARNVGAGAAKDLVAGLHVNGDSYWDINPKCYYEGQPKLRIEGMADSNDAIPGPYAPKNVIAGSPQAMKQSIRRGHIATPSDCHALDSQLRLTAMTAGKGSASTTVKAPMALIGRGRAGEIAVNVILPFFSALARRNGDTRLENSVMNIFLHYPSLPANQLTSYMSETLSILPGVKAGGCLQQGLLRLYHSYCRVKDCECCPVSISRK